MNPLNEISATVWEGLQGRLAGTIVEGIKGLVEGAEEDMRTFGLYIAVDLCDAIRRDDKEWEREIKAQCGVLLEINRLRVVNHQRALLMQVLHALVRMGLEVAQVLVKGAVSGFVQGLTEGSE